MPFTRLPSRLQGAAGRRYGPAEIQKLKSLPCKVVAVVGRLGGPPRVLVSDSIEHVPFICLFSEPDSSAFLESQ